VKIGLRILQRIVREADPYKKHPNRSPRQQTEETIYIVGAIQESPENERYKRTSTPINRGDGQAKPSPEGEGGKRADLGG
jgi:hypothetical protein